MAAISPLFPQSLPASTLHPQELTSIKALASSTGLTSTPTPYTTNPDNATIISDTQVSVPIIDFSLLTSGSPEQRSKVIQELGKACQEWGFFVVINHGMSADLMKAMIDASKRFFDMADVEKKEFEGKHVLDPIKYGTSNNPSLDKVLFWRDFVKIIVHPQFYSLNKPTGFSEISYDFCQRSRIVVRELLKGISESLKLEAHYIEKTMNLESGLQILAANLYPPCPQPELAIGIPPHTDHGLLTLLIQNGINGLQVKHEGKWVFLNPLPNSFLVNTGDHLEILSNGRYKSVEHRAVVNNKDARISIALAHGPSLETMVSPAPEMLNENHPPAFTGMKFKDYFQLMHSVKSYGKSCLDHVRVKTS